MARLQYDINGGIILYFDIMIFGYSNGGIPYTSFSHLHLAPIAISQLYSPQNSTVANSSCAGAKKFGQE